MSWDRLEGAAWLASEGRSGGDAGNNNGEMSGGQARDEKAVLMQAGTGDAEVRVHLVRRVHCFFVFSPTVDTA